MTDKILRYTKDVNLAALLQELEVLMPPKTNPDIMFNGQPIKQAVFTLDAHNDGRLIIAVPNSVAEQAVTQIVTAHNKARVLPPVVGRFDAAIDEIKRATTTASLQKALLSVLEVMNGSTT